MRLPRVEWPITHWDSRLIEHWTALESKAAEMSEAAGSNDAFENAVAELRNMASTGQFGRLVEMLRRRIVARALTWLWLNDEQFSSKMLNPRLLETLVEAQAPRFTRMTLQQLAQLYFRRFDQLDKQHDVRELLERILQQQLEKIPPLKIQSSWVDPLVTLKREASWLLSLDGPAMLAKRVQKDDRELGETFQELGLQGFDDGRYGDVCRTHFYLDTLRNLPVGASDPVFSELLKPLVHMAPFEGSKRIGHVALEILIDRVLQDPSEAWQDFIISLAGDPRIASSARNYREWWQPLGEARIQKVRAWLSKEDLRVFLQAVEQYGIESQNDELKRMFPSRKIFLEGLFKLKLIRNTRLLLGSRASQSVKRILGKDVTTSFAKMDGSMNDKAVIYLDCGDFHIVEGSHSFKIWVYLATPSDSLRSYEKNTFSHFDLINAIPADYRKLYPRLPYEGFVHTPGTWQRRVLAFLASNGVGLDIEQLFSPEDYKRELMVFGLPVVNPNPMLNRTPVVSAVSTGVNQSMTPAVSRIQPSPIATAEAVSDDEKRSPIATGQRPPRHIIKAPISLEVTSKPTVSSLPMATSTSVDNFSSAATDEPSSLPLDLISTDKEVGNPPAKQTSDSKPISRTQNRTPRVSRLDSMGLQVLRYFYDNPGDKARDAADVLSTEAGKVYHVLCNSLKVLCRKDKEHGWQLTDSARLELEIFDEQMTSKPTVSTPPLMEQSSSAVTNELGSHPLDVKSEDKGVHTTEDHSSASRISKLSTFELQVLHYFYDNPGDKARHAASVLGVERQDINHILYMTLKKLFRQDQGYGWRLTEEAILDLNMANQQE